MKTIAQRETEYKQALQKADLFDCNLWWDPLWKDGLVSYPTFEDLIQACEGFGIHGGIVTHKTAISYDNYEGNARLQKLLENHPNWHGSMVLTPDVAFGNAESYIRELMDSGFSAAHMVPVTYEHSMKPYAIDSLLEILADLGLPLMLFHDQVSWDTVDDICTRHPSLNVIITAHEAKFLYYSRNYLCLLKKHKNLYMESHNLVLPLELETIYELTGRMNVVFGTYFPHANPHFAAFRMLDADIPEEAKVAIAHGNAAKLFPCLRGGK